MFMFSFRLRRLPVFLSIVALALVIALSIVGIRNIFRPVTTSADGLPVSQKVISGGKISGKTNEDRIAFLKSFGWEAEPDSLEILEVVIPKEFDEIYQAYNDMQKRQGFDLSAYAGKRCKRYAYRIVGYPGIDEPVRAYILVYKDKIIGGDISSEIAGGFMHGFALS